MFDTFNIQCHKVLMVITLKSQILKATIVYTIRLSRDIIVYKVLSRYKPTFVVFKKEKLLF